MTAEPGATATPLARTPLAAALAGARPATDLGVEVAGDYGDPEGEYRALRDGSGVVDRSARGAVLVVGPDAWSFLQSLLSQDLDPVGDGDGAHALLLEPRGKLVADLRVLRVGPEEAWLDMDVGAGGVLAAGLARYRIRVKVEITDRTGAWGCVTVRGPAADDVVSRALGVEVPAVPHAHVAAGDLRSVRSVGAVRAGWPGSPGVDLVGPVEALTPAWAALVAAGARPCGLTAAEAVRVEAGVPRQGHDLDGSVIAQEAFLERDAVSFTKGCFVGQELVCRIDNRGHVNRYLRGLRLESRSGAPPPPGAEILAGGAPAGRLTSVAASPDLGPIALGFVRREVDPPADVEVRYGAAMVPARVEGLPLRG